MSKKDEVFSDDTPNEPMTLAEKKMAGSHLEWCDLTGSKFFAVHFKKSDFTGINFSGCNFHDVTFGNCVITHACFEGCEIPHSNFDNLKIAGVTVKDLLDTYKQVHGALPDPGYPDRK